MKRRLAIFTANRRGLFSYYFWLLIFISLMAEVVANDKPIVVFFDGQILFPILKSYPETRFGGEFPTEADYQDPYVVELIQEKGQAIWPIIPYSYDTVVKSPPSAEL